jgi:SAM-dependent methyltransferase
MTEDRQAHWQDVYGSKGETEVSWFEEVPSVSLGLIKRSCARPDASIIDIGGGASRLVDTLLDNGFQKVSVLDLSEAGLEAARARVGLRASRVRWLVADVTAWDAPDQEYDVWHDRAAFHFLTESQHREAYVKRLHRALRPEGRVIVGTFALDGPERCSGLPVARYDAKSLQNTLGASFGLEESLLHDHRTPWGGVQRFQFSRFRKLS